MSNSIWKMPGQEQERNEEVLIEYIGITGGLCYIFDEYVRRIPNIKRWCYITDLVAQADKAEWLEKAVNSALISLGTAAVLGRKYVKKYTDAKIDLIKQLIKGE